MNKVIFFLALLLSSTTFAHRVIPIHQFVYDVQYERDGIIVGGLSDAAYLPDEERYYVVNDDRGRHGGAYLWSFSIENNMLSWGEPIGLVTEQGESIKDIEGLAYSSGRWLVSNETDTRNHHRATLYELNRMGVVDKTMTEEQWIPSTPSRNNQGFEALTVWDGQWLAGFEYPVKEAKQVPAGVTRVLVEGGLQLQYQLEDKSIGDFGLVAFDVDIRGKLFSVERSYVPLLGNSIYMFELVRVDHGHPQCQSVLDQVSGCLIKQSEYELTNLFNNKLDNIEALAFGPRTEKGQQFILVSDNNYNPMQRTQINVAELHW